MRALACSAGAVLTAYRRTFVSTKRTTPVGLGARQAIAGTEAADGGQNLILEPFAPLEIRLFIPKFHQELADEGAHGGITLGRPDARAPIHRFRQ